MASPKKVPPTREQLATLAAKLKGAPVVGNDAQANLWKSMGGADSWASMSHQDKEKYRAQHDLLNVRKP